MIHQNQTYVADIVLLGLEGPLSFRVFMFLLFFIAYLVTLGGNSLIIVLVSISYRLHSPMYFFLYHLSIMDIIISSNVVPVMLFVNLRGRGTISFSSCLTQLFFFGISADVECLLLTVMSYDRYLAICDPLHYKSIMVPKLQLLMVTCCWLVSLAIASLVIVHILELHFCGANTINHFFCDLDPLLDMSCSDTLLVRTEILVAGIPVTVFAVVFIIVTYICIFCTIFGSSTTTNGRKKAFSTCSSHLTVVCMYYGTLICNYIIPIAGQAIHLTKYLSLLYTVITPLLNPLIYTLRNQEIRSALTVYISKLVDWF
ncbi:hypothetical protein XELAEV_18019359mg [Xenopus laevis]|uniref:Olfactory receptor n=1 Tax=Xenopus laevis TaxID=8355 RepID=A0A974DFI2_XENLA|nr:hypothetical protein XELAEV_18019359mg [Xenopus laevis]